MNRLQVSFSLSLLSLLSLTGCAGFGTVSFPDASVNPQYASLGSISGSNFGGHAPLIGAHVYVLQPGVTAGSGTASATAYGAQATSILNQNNTANGSNNPVAVKNASDPGIPTSWYYQTTDLTGAFNITGDYTCTVGLPVYLYLYGGSPTFPSQSNTFNVTSISSNNTTGEITFTVNTEENAYSGELVSFSGLTATNNYQALNNNGTRPVIADSTLTTTTFSISVGAGNVPNGTNIASGGTATFSPTFNPGVVNLATLGNCPAGGFTGANAISYVFVNEVSTAATAYAFQPFTSPSNNSAIDIGTSSNNVAGIQNAAVIAKQLYDITGSQLSTTFAGEGHIANTKNPAGTGIIPQANIDTIGNILAACVDSNNQSNVLGNAAMSAQCTTLFTNATNTGIPTTSTGTGVNAPGTAPLDIAVAALNMARHPAGPPSSYSPTGSSSFMAALYQLPTGNTPFTPDLKSTGAGQPNDFTIAILYTTANNPGPDTFPLTTGAESVAVDKIGNAWFTTQPNKGTGAGYFFQLSPAGVASNIQYNATYIYGYVTIDSGESAWAGAANTSNPVSYVHATATPAAASGTAPTPYTYATGATNTASTAENYTYAAIASSTGNVYFGNNGAGGTTDYVQTFAGAATTPTVKATESAAIPTVTTASGGLSHGAMQAGGTSGYFDYNAASGHGTPYVSSVVLSSGANNTDWPVSNATTGCTAMLDPEQMAVVRSGDVIVPDYYNGTGTANAATSSAYYITSGGTCTQLSGATLAAGMNSPFGATVDGNDYVYLTNRGGSSISVLNTSGGTAATTVAVSPSLGYTPQYNVSGTLTNMLANPLNIAAGPSGELWITDYGNNSIVEIIGLAAPTTTPLSVAAIAASATAGSIGYRP